MTPPTHRLMLPEPPSANRWWRRAGTHMHLSAEAKRYKAAVAAVIGRRVTPLTGEVSVSIVWYRKARRGDLDKRVGILLDALQGVCYTNDNQVAELRALRTDGDRYAGQVYVVVAPLDPTQDGNDRTQIGKVA